MSAKIVVIVDHMTHDGVIVTGEQCLCVHQPPIISVVNPMNDGKHSDIRGFSKKVMKHFLTRA